MKKFLLVAAVFASALMVGLNVSGFSKAEIETRPFFNQYTDVAGIGNEKDFLRVQNDDGTRVNTKEVCSGTTKLWIYVHNNQGSSNNDDTTKTGAYDGVGVARNTKVKLSLPGTFTNSTTATAKVSADNSVNAPTDTAYVTCGSKKVKVEYVGVESVSSSDGQNSFTLTGDIMSANGASLNYKGMTGVVPGCWEYRASIVVKVKITEEPPVVQKQALTCEAVVVNRKGLGVSAAVQGKAVNGASITGYRIVWGDGSADATTQTATHAYKEYDKSYTLKAYVKGKLDGKDVEVTSDKCAYTFSEKTPEKPPVTPPTPPELPNTGAGSVIGIAAVVAVLGTIAHRVWTIRRVQ